METSNQAYLDRALNISEEELKELLESLKHEKHCKWR